MDDAIEPITDERLAELEGLWTLERLQHPSAHACDILALLARVRKAEAREKRYREALEEARRRLAKGRALWNGPCHEADHVLADALGQHRYEARYVEDQNSDTETPTTIGWSDTWEGAQKLADAWMKRPGKPVAWVIDRYPTPPVNLKETGHD